MISLFYMLNTFFMLGDVFIHLGLAFNRPQLGKFKLLEKYTASLEIFKALGMEPFQPLPPLHF